MTDDIRFSLIVAAYNEKGDIGDCLDALVDIQYSNKEIIAVDDASTDQTPEILESYADDFEEVVALHNETNTGVAGTRNRGLERATGDVVVIVNADVLLRPDHLDRLAEHYQAGADFVVCRSVVANSDTAIGTFIQAQEDHYLSSDVDRVWSEGWSARRVILEEAGGFDERYPSASGEDAALGYELLEKHERVVDNDITVPHVAPEETSVFRRERQGRGRGRAYYELLHEGDAMPKKFQTEFGKLGLFILLFPITIPLAAAFLGKRGLHYYQLEGRYPLALLYLTLLDTFERRRGYYRTLWQDRNSEEY